MFFFFFFLSLSWLEKLFVGFKLSGDSQIFLRSARSICTALPGRYTSCTVLPFFICRVVSTQVFFLSFLPLHQFSSSLFLKLNTLLDQERRVDDKWRVFIYLFPLWPGQRALSVFFLSVPIRPTFLSFLFDLLSVAITYLIFFFSSLSVFFFFFFYFSSHTLPFPAPTDQVAVVGHGRARAIS